MKDYFSDCRLIEMEWEFPNAAHTKKATVYKQ